MNMQCRVSDTYIYHGVAEVGIKVIKKGKLLK